MGGSLARGYKVAAATLVLEAILAFGLVSDTLGIFVIFAMVIVGIAWLPAAVMILADARSESGGITLPAWIIGGACGIVGGLCLLTFGKWMLMSLVVR